MANPPKITSEQIEAIMSMTQLMAETTNGYFKKLTDGGIPADIAGEMTKEFHHMLVESASSSAKLGQR